jgi:hypothetical protein
MLHREHVSKEIGYPTRAGCDSWNGIATGCGGIRRAAVEGCFSLSVIARFLGLGESEGRGLSIRHRPLLEHSLRKHFGNLATLMETKRFRISRLFHAVATRPTHACA